MSETVTVRLPVYRTPDGEPTCIRDNMTGLRCEFVAVQINGHALCRYPGIERAIDDGSDWTTPHDACPLWSHADRGPGFTHSGDNGVDCGCRT